MNLTLIREAYVEDGIFGRLLDESQNFICFTLEHAYQTEDGNWLPKLSPGTHTCCRGEHVLHSGPIETFEILGTPGHTGILFHPGNSEKDSEGCVLLGLDRNGVLLLHSRDAFHRFMALQVVTNEFTLEVE